MEMRKVQKKKEKTCTMKTAGQTKYSREMMAKQLPSLLVEENFQTSQVMQVHKRKEERGVTLQDNTMTHNPSQGTSGYSKPRQEPPTQGVNR